MQRYHLHKEIFIESLQTLHSDIRSQVDKLTELLLELLLGQSFINPNLEILFKECAHKLMLRWPSIADKYKEICNNCIYIHRVSNFHDHYGHEFGTLCIVLMTDFERLIFSIFVARYIPIMESAFLKDEKESVEISKKRIMAVELLANIQPLRFFQHKPEHVLSVQNILYLYASPGSFIWYQIAVSIDMLCCFMLRYSSFVRALSLLTALVTADYMHPREIAESFTGAHCLDRILR